MKNRTIEVLRAVHWLTVKNGGSPNYDEIANAVGMSKGGVLSGYIKDLREAGYLTKKKEGRKARNLEVTAAGKWQIAYSLLPPGQRWVLENRRCPGCPGKARYRKGFLYCEDENLPIYGGRFWAEALERAEQAAYKIGGE